MCKLLNRIRYGDSSTPKFISSKNKWLYKNKWTTNNNIYNIISKKTIHYTYSINNNNTFSMGEVDTFNELIDIILKNPMKVSIPYPKQFSVQEINIIINLLNKQTETYQNDIIEKISKAAEELNKIKFN